MRTVLYLLRHAAAEANPEAATAADPPLARLGIRQAELTRDFLAVRPIDHCYCSPLRRAVETASIIVAPHGLEPEPLEELAERDPGPSAILPFDADPSRLATEAMDRLLTAHAGRSLLVVAHHLMNRTYLARLLGLTPAQARQVTLDNCGISVVVREGEQVHVSTLNASFHLQGLAA
jgi:broad specificity phosphatase PhoE